MKKCLVWLITVSLVFSVFVGFGSISFAQKKKYNEAPMLAELVKAGKLPPVEERLPEEPLVVGPGTLIPREHVDLKIGQYGGTMRYATARTDVCAELYDAVCEPPLMTPGKLRAGKGITDIKPNLFKKFEVSKDQKSITFYLRKGMKWSDGTPVTTEDVRFCYEDIYLNKDLTPVFPRILRSANRLDGEPGKLEIIDKYTFRLSFKDPGLAVLNWISQYGTNWNSLLRPAHYLKQFHPKYTPWEKLDPLLKQENLTRQEWWKLFQTKDEGTLGWGMVKAVNPDYPTLSPWMLEKRTPTVITWVRNPYYWKVDRAGNQLPYIDRLRIEIVSNAEAVLMKILSGEVDWAREYASMANLPLYKENEEKGGYRIVFLPMHVAPVQIAFNFTNPDPVWRQVVIDVRFRKALNIAINHDHILKTIYKGFGKVPTIIPSEYNPQEASRLLDEMGLNKRDSEGWRLGPDGKRFIIPLEVPAGFTPEQDALCELLVEYWQAVGLKTNFKSIDATLYWTRRDANQAYTILQWAHTGFWRDTPMPSDFLPTNSRLWLIWHDSLGKEGEEPPQWAKRLWELSDRAATLLPSASEMKKISNEIFKILYENVPFILPIDYGVYPLIGSKRLGNVPKDGYAILASFTQEQFFFAK